MNGTFGNCVFWYRFLTWVEIGSATGIVRFIVVGLPGFGLVYSPPGGSYSKIFVNGCDEPGCGIPTLISTFFMITCPSLEMRSDRFTTSPSVKELGMFN
jgi:hypothetical protein